MDSNMNSDTVTLKEAAEILGLKYHTARKLLLNANVGFIDYGVKRLWLKQDILDFKQSCYKPAI